MLGTKWPSITSRWIQSAPAASTLRISSPRREKSDASTEGEITRGRGAKGWDMGLPALRNVSGRLRVTCAPIGSNVGENFSCGRKNLPRRQLLPAASGASGQGKPLFHWVFHYGTALAEKVFEKPRACRSYSYVACLRRRIVR